ncbi:MAG TPA: hypothetical protein VEG26_01230 [Steroidobacteraceae bacterium]|nr:hypothetical protein [Steroidobacteraceae bacterium]
MCAKAADLRCRCATLGVSAEAAALLLAFAMRESEAPAVELGSALQRLDRGLQPAAPGAAREALTRDLAACVRALQFHDRLMQQLAVIRNLLTRLADHPLPQMAGFGAQRWEELLAALRERLAAESHDELFELLVRSGGVGLPGSAREAQAEGSGELF